MKHLRSFNNFGLNETKKETSPLDLFKKDVKSLIDDMFASAKKIKYEYNKEGFPTSVEFEIEKADFKIGYDEKIRAEFSEGVMKKREYEAVLVFDDKWEEKIGDKNVFMISFDIQKEKIDPEKYKKEEKQRKYNFKKDSDEQLKKKLQSGKFTEDEKQEIIEILIDRGVEYDKPEEDEDDKEESEEEMDKKAKEEAAKKKVKKDKKNEAYETGDPELEYGYCGCGKDYCLVCNPVDDDDDDDITPEPKTIAKPASQQEQGEEECHCELCGESIVNEECGCGSGDITDPDNKPTKCDCGQPGCKECNPEPKCECGKSTCNICNPGWTNKENESIVHKFGTPEWCEKYHVKIEEDVKEETLEEKVYKILNNKE